MSGVYSDNLVEVEKVAAATAPEMSAQA